MVQMVEGLLPIHSRVLFELFKIPINMVDFSSVPESLVIFNPVFKRRVGGVNSRSHV